MIDYDFIRVEDSLGNEDLIDLIHTLVSDGDIETATSLYNESGMRELMRA